jgi:hypothetical protein
MRIRTLSPNSRTRTASSALPVRPLQLLQPKKRDSLGPSLSQTFDGRPITVGISRPRHPHRLPRLRTRQTPIAPLNLAVLCRRELLPQLIEAAEIVILHVAASLAQLQRNLMQGKVLKEE